MQVRSAQAHPHYFVLVCSEFINVPWGERNTCTRAPGEPRQQLSRQAQESGDRTPIITKAGSGLEGMSLRISIPPAGGVDQPPAWERQVSACARPAGFVSM